MLFRSVQILLTPGDIITSKKGMLFHFGQLVPGEDEFYRVFKTKYLGNGSFEALKKEPAEGIRKVSEEETKPSKKHSRCSKCKEFYKQPSGTKCPDPDCKGVMQ